MMFIDAKTTHRQIIFVAEQSSDQGSQGIEPMALESHKVVALANIPQEILDPWQNCAVV